MAKHCSQAWQVSHAVTSGYRGKGGGAFAWDLFWDRFYWAPSMYEEAVLLPLEANREVGRGDAVAEAHKFAMGPFHYIS
jgi:hypothetical protein